MCEGSAGKARLLGNIVNEIETWSFVKEIHGTFRRKICGKIRDPSIARHPTSLVVT